MLLYLSPQSNVYTSTSNHMLTCRFLFAKCCLALSKYTEAEKALSLSNNMHPRHITESDLVKIPGGAGGLYLLGEICRREQRKEYAIEYFRQALKVVEFVIHCSLEMT